MTATVRATFPDRKSSVAEPFNQVCHSPDAWERLDSCGRVNIGFIFTYYAGPVPPPDVTVKQTRQHKKRVRAAHDPASPFPQMVGADEVAVALGCSVQHVYALAAAGRLPQSRFDGRIQFAVDGIRDYLRDHEVA